AGGRRVRGVPGTNSPLVPVRGGQWARRSSRRGTRASIFLALAGKLARLAASPGGVVLWSCQGRRVALVARSATGATRGQGDGGGAGGGRHGGRTGDDRAAPLRHRPDPAPRRGRDGGSGQRARLP